MVRPGIRSILGVACLLGVAVLVGGTVLAVAETRRLAADRRGMERAAGVLGFPHRVLATLEEAEADHLRYLLTGRDEDLYAYDETDTALDEQLQGLRALREDPEHRDWAGALEIKVRQELKALREAVALRHQRGDETAMRMDRDGAGRRALDDIRDLVDGWEDEQQRALLDGPASGPGARTGRILAAVAWVAGTALLVIALLYVVILRLLAARRRSEATLRDQLGHWRVTLASIGDAVIVTDAAGRVTFMNQMAESLCGRPRDGAVRKPLNQVLRLIHEETRQPAEDPFSLVLREGTILGLAHGAPAGAVPPAGTGTGSGRSSGLTEHIALIAEDGSERPICYNAAPVRDRSGDILGMILVFHDDTDRRRYEKELVDANRRKDEFLAMLAHELRNPLASIRSALEVFDAPGANGHPEWAKEILHRQVRHLAHLLDDLLDISRITWGKIHLRTQHLDARVVIQRAVESVRLLIEGRGHRLELAVAPRELPVKADPVRLEQVLVNLLTNAATYTPPGGLIRLAVAAQGGQVIMRVEDTGTGIAPEVLPHVFDLFAQGKRSLARSESGLGIGLTIVKKLVELHGGSITARSEGPGRGSQFLVSLPAAGPLPPAPSPPPAEPARRQGLKVLIVDDNRDLVRGLSLLLKVLGYQVETAFDGPTGVEAARAHRPDVVLLDIGLPRLDGYQVAHCLRQEEGLSQALIIGMSGYAQEEDRRRSREAGMDYHLAKPVDLKTIAALIAQPRPPEPR